jgi:hypothetical protein
MLADIARLTAIAARLKQVGGSSGPHLKPLERKNEHRPMSGLPGLSRYSRRSRRNALSASGQPVPPGLGRSVGVVENSVDLAESALALRQLDTLIEGLRPVDFELAGISFRELMPVFHLLAPPRGRFMAGLLAYSFSLRKTSPPGSESNPRHSRPDFKHCVQEGLASSHCEGSVAQFIRAEAAGNADLDTPGTASVTPTARERHRCRIGVFARDLVCVAEDLLYQLQDCQDMDHPVARR